MKYACKSCGVEVVISDADMMVANNNLCEICKILSDAGKLDGLKMKVDERVAFKRPIKDYPKIDVTRNRRLKKYKKTFRVKYVCSDPECGHIHPVMPWSHKCGVCGSRVNAIKTKEIV